MALFSGPCGRAARRPRGSAYHLYYCMTPLLSRLRAHVARRRVFAAPGTAVVAVAGGAGSAAPLEPVHTPAPELRLPLVVPPAGPGIPAGSGTGGRAGAALPQRLRLSVQP